MREAGPAFGPASFIAETLAGKARVLECFYGDAGQGEALNWP